LVEFWLVERVRWLQDHIRTDLGIDGVDHADVHLEDKTARVEYDASRVNTKQMAEAVEEKGYMIVP
jgi:cation transport ATPase